MGFFDRFKRKQKNEEVTQDDALDYKQAVYKKAEQTNKEFDAFLGSLDDMDKKIDELSTPSQREVDIARKGASSLLSGYARQQYKENYDEYVRNNEYANTFDQLLGHMFHQQLNDNLGLHIHAPYSGTTEKGVLAQYNYDKLVKTYSAENALNMFIPYLQEVEEKCGSLQYATEHLPRSAIDMYTTYKKDSSDDQAKKLINGLIMIKVSGIADLENSRVFPSISTDTRQSFFGLESKITNLRQTAGIADQLPPEYKKCIHSEVSKQPITPAKPKAPRSIYDPTPPEL